MAKTKPETQPQPQPVAPASGALALAPTNDELAGLGDLAFDDDGLGPIERDDIKIATYVLNFGGQSKDGRAVPKDEYYNTVDERSKHKVNAVFLHRHKSNLYSRFNDAENKTEIFCRSSDRVTGIWQADQHERKCEGCPDAEWRATMDGKRKRNCSEVYNMFAVDLDEALGFVVRFKKTALPVIKSYLQKHHIGRRVIAGERSNYPLYVFGVELSGKMVGTYAVPLLARTRVLSAEEIANYATQAKSVREIVMPLINHLDTQAPTERDAERDAEGGGDTSFDTSKLAADEGRDFADTTST